MGIQDVKKVIKTEGISETVHARAGSTEITGASFLMERELEPSIIVIIGASGDLTARKLLPSLYNLYLKGNLPDPFLVVCCSRSKMDHRLLKERIKERLGNRINLEGPEWGSFCKFIYFQKIEYDDISSYFELATFLQGLNKNFKTLGNKTFYFAIPPSLYKTTAKMLGESGLSIEGKNENGWSRIVVEKPFGKDLKSAIDLDRTLHRYFKEHQIFRIDHYLAKETVQNILMFRFANAIFEPLWNRRYIDHISITVAETLGVEHRAGFYEQAGVLRDMFQNHMMQLLSLTAMDPPSLFEADRVRDEKVRVYRALRPFPVEDLKEYIILGQYVSGKINGKKVSAYRDEPDVNPVSLIPTFAMMKVFLDNWRWQGVPFYLISGKRLAKKSTNISIQFKEVPHSMFRQILGEHITANRLILFIYPDEKITLTFQAKSPGARVGVRSVTMDFLYNDHRTGLEFDAYEKVLLDCMLGDHMLFWRQDGVELCWSFLTPILNKCETCSDRGEMLLPYASGSWGPKAAQELMQRLNTI
jgi:glucose-6-phosphate 1-dehydrogenase